MKTERRRKRGRKCRKNGERKIGIRKDVSLEEIGGGGGGKEQKERGD